MNCGQCANAQFQLTPTGRFRRNDAGRCGKSNDLLERFKKTLPPCLNGRDAYAVCIWPEYDAEHCPAFEKKAKPSKETA